MGRASIMLRVDSEVLRRLISGKETFSERAQKFGISKQALNQWMTDGKMPPRAIAELVHDLDIGIDDVNALLEPQRKASAEKKKWTLTVTLEES